MHHFSHLGINIAGRKTKRFLLSDVHYIATFFIHEIDSSFDTF